MTSDRLERAVLAARQLDAGAGAALDEFPGIALEVGGGGTLARRARAGGAIVLALQRHAKAFLLMGGDGRIPLGLGQRGGGSDGRKRRRDGAGKDQGTDKILRRHSDFLLLRVGIAYLAKAHGLVRPAQSRRYQAALTTP